MSDDLFELAMLATAVLAGMIAFVAACIRASTRRGLSDWVMIGGMGCAMLGLVLLILIEFVIEPWNYERPPTDYVFWERVQMAIAFAMPGGLLIFSGGFLLSRFEARKQARQLEMFRQGLHPPGDAGPLECGGFRRFGSDAARDRRER